MDRTEQIHEKWRQLESEYVPQIQAARAAVEAVEAEFADVRQRRNEAVDRHKKLQDEYAAAWDVVGKTGGS